MVTISIVNQSTLLKDDQLAPAIAAVQKQIHDDFAPAWGTDAILVHVRAGEKPPAEKSQIVLLNTSDFGAVLGYHDLTPDGFPLGKVFVSSEILRGTSWTATLSHEVLEMLADPDISTVVEVGVSRGAGVTKSVFVSREICDPCEADKFGYKINNVLVSDFVYPAWYQGFRKPASTRFDHQRYVSRPLQLLEDGYMSMFENGQWIDVGFGDKPTNYFARPRLGSRRERRRIARQQWLRSVEPAKESK